MEQALSFTPGQRVEGLQGDPFGMTDVARRNTARPFTEVGEFLGRAFEGQRVAAGLERSHRENLPMRLKDQVVAPLDMLSGPRQPEADLTNPLQIRE